MADLTYDAAIRFKGEVKSEIFFLDTSSAQTVYKGQPMILSATDWIYVRGFVTATNVADVDICVGIAAEGKSVLSAGAENTEIKIVTAPSIVGFKSTVFDNADLGKTVYMSDSATLSETAADNPQIGTLFKVEDGYAYVKLTTPQICSGAGA